VLQEYIADVETGRFPQAEHCYPMKAGEAEKLETLLESES
jgi:hypothetical protein